MIHRKILWRLSTERRWLQPFAVFGVLLMLLLATSPQPLTAQDQDDEPPWRNLTCNATHQQYQGIEYCTGQTEQGGIARVLVVDLHDESGIRFEYIMAIGKEENGRIGPCMDVNRIAKGLRGCDDPNEFPPPGTTLRDGTPIETYYPVMTLLQATERFPDTAAVVDTDYGAGTHDPPDSREHGPEGLTIVSGSRIDGRLMKDGDNNAVRRPWVVISANAPFQVLFDQLDGDDGSKPEDWMNTAFGGAPWLIRSGEKQSEDISLCRSANSTHPCTSSEAQTAIAISADRRWLYLVVADGVDADGITNFIRDALQPQEAIKLDGGGSSQMWYGGLPEGQRVVRQGNRQLSHYLAIIAPPGDGIDLELATPVPLPDPRGWWARLVQNAQQWWQETWPPLQERASQWWQRTWDGVQQRASEWWQEQQENLARWLEEELARWVEEELERAISQLCGAAVLPSTLAVAVWIQNHRRKRQ